MGATGVDSGGDVMNKQWCRVCMVAAMVVLCGGLAASVAQAQPTPEKPAFTVADMMRIRAFDTPQAERLRLQQEWRSFVPTTEEGVDVIYGIIAATGPGYLEAERKLETLRDPALLARSRTYIKSDYMAAAKAAVKIACKARDTAAIPAIQTLLRDPKAQDDFFFYQDALAQLQDPDLFKSLSDPAQMPTDPNLRDIRLQMLQQYGEKAIPAVDALAEKGKITQEEKMRFMATFPDDKVATKEIIKAYRSATTIEAKEAALAKMARAQGPEVDAILREAYEDKGLMTDIGSETRTKVKTAILAMDDKEARELRQEFIRMIGEGDPVEEYMTFQMASVFKADIETERDAALAMAKQLRGSKWGSYAGKALEELTGQAFQFKGGWEAESRAETERWKTGHLNAADLEITPESVAKYETQTKEWLAEYRAALEKDPKLTPEERERRCEESQRQFQNALDNKKKLLNEASPPEPGSVGIPVDEAEKWINEHYANRERGKNVQP